MEERERGTLADRRRLSSHHTPKPTRASCRPGGLRPSDRDIPTSAGCSSAGASPCDEIAGNAADRLRRARPATAGNPIAAAIVARATAHRGGERDGLLAAAAALRDVGCRYQWARTLIGEPISTDRAPAALGAYSQAIVAAIRRAPADSGLRTRGPHADLALRVLRNFAAGPAAGFTAGSGQPPDPAR